ncbi:MAG: response regulator transcription factor [Alicyclobacillaceae bacterium]|nr:response regulator transcription factor [Alicyclobacillaceae bacterium]
MAPILVVDDEASIVKLVAYNLSQAGFDVITSDNGPEALALARRHAPELIVLDLMLPGMSGLDVCRTLRADGVKTPIIMLTARDDEIDRVLGLEMGADDYITKPFSPRELVARVKAVLRRTADADSLPRAPDVLRIGRISVRPAEHEVTVDGQVVELTAREFALLVHLMENAGRVLTRDQLLQEIWGYDFPGGTRIVDVHISHLRDKLEPDPKNPRYIRTVRGVGYKFAREEALL